MGSEGGMNEGGQYSRTEARKVDRRGNGRRRVGKGSARQVMAGSIGHNERQREKHGQNVEEK